MRKYGEQKKLFISLGSFLKHHLNQDSQSQSTQSPPRRTVVRQTGCADREAWVGRAPLHIPHFSAEALSLHL